MHILKRFLKICTLAIGFLLLLLILLMLLLRIPSVQNKVLQTAIPSIESLLGGADVEIARVDLDLFDAVGVEGILIRDLRGDTLVFAQELGIDIGAFSLVGAELFVDEIRLEGGVVNAYKLAQDTTFNYQFILDAFAKTEPTPVDTSASAFAFGLRTVKLLDTRIRMLDEKASSDLNFRVGRLLVDVESLDFESLAVDIENIEVADVKGSYFLSARTGESIVDQASDTLSPNSIIAYPYAGLPISVGQLSLKQVDLQYRDDNTSPVSQGFDSGNIYLKGLSAEASNLNWDSTALALNWEELNFREQSGLEVDDLRFNLEVTPSSVDLANFEFRTSESKVLAKAAFNFSSFESLVSLDPTTKVLLELDETYLSFADLQRLAPMLQDVGVNLNATTKIFLDGSVTGSFERLMLDGLNVRLGNQTGLIASGQVSNPLDMENLSYKLSISRLTSSYSDLNRLTSGIDLPAGLADFGRFSFSGSLSGTGKDLDGENLSFSTDGITSFEGDVKLQSLDDIDNLFVDAQVKTLKTNAQELRAFIPDSLAVDLASLGNIGFVGNYKGTLTDFKVDGDLKSALGSLSTDLKATFNKDYSDASYKGDLNLAQFDLGTFLRDTTLGTLTLDIELDGKGLSIEDVASNLKGKVGAFTYLGYTYHDIDFNGKLNEQMFEGFLKIDDPNVKFIFNGLVDLNESIPKMVFEASLDTIALQPLNLYDGPLGLSTSISANLVGNSADNLIGGLRLDTILLQNGDRTAELDELKINAGDTTGGRFLSLDSEVLKGQVLGLFTVSELADAIITYIDNFFPVAEFVSPQAEDEQAMTALKTNKISRPQDFMFSFELSDPTRLVQLFDEGLTELDTASLVGTFNREEKLDASFYMPGISYAGIIADSILAEIIGEKEDLLLTTHTRNLLIGGTEVFTLNADVKLGRDSLVFSIGALAEADSTLLSTQLAVTQNQAGRYSASFNEDLDIVGQTWAIDPQNTIEYWNNYLDIRNLNFSKDDQRILLTSSDESTDKDIAPISLKIENFNLQEFETLVPVDSFRLTGRANGTVAVKDPYGNLYYTADLTLNDIVMNGEPVGTFIANASSDGLDDLVGIDVRLDGSVNDLAIAGTYDIQTGGLEMNANIRAIQLRLIDPLALDVLSNTQGVMRSKMVITGNVDAPVLNGFVALDDAATTVELLGARFKVADSRIDLSEELLDFNTFVLADSSGREATISGTIAHDYFTDFLLDLNLSTDGFKVLGTQPNLEELYYGSAIVAADLAISGDLDIPVIRGTAATREGTDITIVPLISVNGVSQEDWVIYADPETLAKDTLVDLNDLYQANTLGIDLAIAVIVEEDAALNVLIDPATGDALNAYGNAELNINMTPDGDISVTGLYEIDRGAYQFTLPTLGVKLRQYDFEIKKGSNMRFVGDPLDSRFDITAIYSTETTTYELLQLESSSSIDEGQAASAKRRQTVNVLMEMKGTIDDPDILLDIDVPESGGSIATNDVQRILDGLSEQSMYEQVFSLLVFNSFNAFGGGGSASTPADQGAQLAINSLSNLVSSQLNKLADKALAGFDINIGLDSYKDRYTGSRQNSANVDLSRSLFNDRLTITFGTDVNVGSNDLVAGDNTAGFQSNFILSYQLTDSGRYFVSVFRRPDYDVISTNTPYENGVGVRYSKKFD